MDPASWGGGTQRNSWGSLVSLLTAIAERAWPAWIWDCDRRAILTANEAALARWGLPKAFDTSALIFREDDPSVLAIGAASAHEIQDGKPVPLEVPLPFEGAPHFYQLRHLPELGEGIVLLEAPLGGFEALSGRRGKQAREVPTWSPELANAIPLPILLCDLEGMVLSENNEASAQRQRAKRGDIAGRLTDWFDNPAKVKDLIHHITADGHANLIATGSTRLDGQTLQVFGHRLTDPTWETARLLIVLHILPQPLKREATPSAAEEARATWRQAAEDVAPLGFELSAQKRIIFFTRSCSALFELPASQLGGARLEDLGFTWDAKATTALQEGRAWTSAGLTRTTTNGDLLDFETSGTPIFDSAGTFLGYQIVGRHAAAPVLAPEEDHALNETPAPSKPKLPTKSATGNIKMPLDYNTLDLSPDGVSPLGDDNLVRLDDWRPSDSPAFLPKGEFASYVEGLDAALLGLDEEGRIAFANTKAGTLLDHDPEDLEGLRITFFFEKGFSALLGAYFSENANPSISKTFHEGVTANLKLADGSHRVISLKLHPLREKSSVKYCALLQPDLTGQASVKPSDLKDKEGDLPLSQKESDFLALVSHEIRTPLNAILGFSDLMLQENFGPLGNARYKDYINDIHESGALILSLVEDLLRRSKGEEKKSDLKLQPVDLKAQIEKARRLMAPQADARQVRITVEMEKGLPRILGDDRSVLQILLNILSNAIKYSRHGGDVVIWAGPLANGRVRIHIQDNGMGMSEDDLKIAMEPYGRTDEATRLGIKGTGLGLPLARALALANRADFKIDSTPRSGTMVRIDFHPARAAAE
ncbi:MAG: PAS domain-containing sensor histidine kinase [Alphaproteobacteria bacterium]|nr:MAG: PAS domain-containing sensor histidine kinase [Alphaproteobacteria bacterium]